jgi:hypothetical protein
MSGGWRPSGWWWHGDTVAAALVVGLIGSGGLVWQGTNAVFSATTSNAANTWSAGTVNLSDDDSSAAMFTAAGLVPGTTGANCLTVTYSGTLATAVKLYASTPTGTLAPYLDVVVSEGSGGGFGSCAGFSGTQIFSGTLAALATASSSYATGIGSFAPSTPGSTKVYKFTWTLDSATPNGQQSATTSATFTWESQA